ncbi:unnamed protein product [Oikopleura dioica]|uniref:Uncharacterized protein n=1 Tax=Oikopleura dioica TaxID=34765 RepID=E4Y7B7_OIKDI|nr:unnamed protein product [Oikopleura dioica]
MKDFLISSLILFGGTDARKRHERRSKNHHRANQKEALRISQLSPRVLNSCILDRASDMTLLETFQFLEPESNKRVYFGTAIDVARGNPQAAKNSVEGEFGEDVIVTRSNGYCDKGVYKSWNKCNINGECFVECDDGLCHDEHRSGAQRIVIPNGCRDWYRACATECAEDEQCNAFTFLDTNILGHPEYTCHFMNSLTCKHSAQNLNDPRSSFHVKGAYMEGLFAKYSAASFEELDSAMTADPDFEFGHWSSWGYHECRQTPAPACGEGVIKRSRKLAAGSTEHESRPCNFSNDDGELIVCEDVSSDPTEEDPGHGWTAWGEWSTCSKTCGGAGFRSRFRACGQCTNPDENGLCESVDIADAISFVGENLEFCVEGGELENENCQLGQCLPGTHGRDGWKQAGQREFKIRHMWNIAKTEDFTQTLADWEGGCRNIEDAYKVLNLDSSAQEPAFHNPRFTFAECMRHCQLEEKDACLSVMFFKSERVGAPDVTKFYGNDAEGNPLEGNCYLFNKRCHEDGQPRDAAFVAAQKEAGLTGKATAVSWYAYKDLCHAPKSVALNPCNMMGTYYRATCDSTGDRAFPNTDVCHCPASGDRLTEARVFGNAYAAAWAYNPELGMFEKRSHNAALGKGPSFYSKFKYERRVFAGTSLEEYEEIMREGSMACHNPCEHNRCASGAECRINSEAEFGYDCICQWPTVPDTTRFGEGLLPLGQAGYGKNDGCVAVDQRNVAPEYKDNLILYGGGWNSQPVESGPFPKPHYQYYGLESVTPYKFKVSHAPQKIPAPSPTAHKAKFYNCMMNIDDNKVMVVGGRPGQFFDIWDDKTFVYEWQKGADGIEIGGQWIGADGSWMNDTKESCEGLSGCMRHNDWPDFPSTSVLNCEGQCRDGQAGRGPTNPRWIQSYCTIESDFYNGNDWVNQRFELCRHRIVQSDDGITVEGLDGLWSSEENPEFEAQWTAYNIAIRRSITFYRQSQLASPDVEDARWHTTQMFQGESHLMTGELRWKYPMDSSLYSPILGPVHYRDIMQTQGLPNTIRPLFRETVKEYHGPGQPACGVMGNRAYVGSGKFSRLMSLDFTAATEQLWRVEDGSEFPFPFKKSDGSQCLMYNANGDSQEEWTRDQLPNYRQNFGTVVTSQGLWVIGGLMAPSADLPGRNLNKKYNVEGCTKQAHLKDVWVFSPNGWSRNAILGDARETYAGLTGGQILPEKIAYPFGNGIESRISTSLPQTFENFHLSDTPSGAFNLTIDSALAEGWGCTGVQGKWCRKPYLPRETKGAESFVMCFEPGTGTEDFSYVRRGSKKTIPRRPRVCSVEETKNQDNRCICFIMNISGQSGAKQTPGGAGFRPEIDYLEVPRADGTYGSEHESYADELKEYCPDAEPSYPGIDESINHGDETPVADFTECTPVCDVEGAPACNRVWKKKNLRAAWHEAGRIKHPRMGFLAGQLKGEIVVWGGECYGPANTRQWNLDGTLRATRVDFQPRSCKVDIQAGKTINDDYMEVFSFLRMNSAGFIFGERRYVEFDGYVDGRAGHGEAAVAQAFNAFNKAF